MSKVLKKHLNSKEANFTNEHTLTPNIIRCGSHNHNSRAKIPQKKKTP